MRYTYLTHRPDVHTAAFLAPGARISGEVEIGAEASVWFNAVLRGDRGEIRVGARTNIQDGAVLHGEGDLPCHVGEDCTVGHNAILHACRIDDRCLIGMGALILSRARIAEESLVAAGALVPPDKEFPPRSLVLGSPARVVRTLTDEDVARLIRPTVEVYRQLAREHRASLSDST